MQTKRSVLSELELKAVMMGQPGSVEVEKFPHALISIYLVLAFTPFVTFLIVNVAAEKEHRLKDTMTMMGLYDTAFWWGETASAAAHSDTRTKETHVHVYVWFDRLSWGLLYAALVTTMSILMAIIATYTALFPNSNFLVIFFLIFLYGISSVSRAGMEGKQRNKWITYSCGYLIPAFVLLVVNVRSSHPYPDSVPQIFFSFMLTPLFKKPKFASTVGSMLTVVFGCLSLFTVLVKDFPQPLVWLLCLLSPSAFSIGIAQVQTRSGLLWSTFLLLE